MPDALDALKARVIESGHTVEDRRRIWKGFNQQFPSTPPLVNTCNQIRAECDGLERLYQVDAMVDLRHHNTLLWLQSLSLGQLLCPELRVYAEKKSDYLDGLGVLRKSLLFFEWVPADDPRRASGTGKKKKMMLFRFEETAAWAKKQLARWKALGVEQYTSWVPRVNRDDWT